MIILDGFLKRLRSSVNALRGKAEEGIKECDEMTRSPSAAKDEEEYLHATLPDGREIDTKSQVYIKLPDGREIYTLDYLAILRFCKLNNIDFRAIDFSVDPNDPDRRVVYFCCHDPKAKYVGPLFDLTFLRVLWLPYTQIDDVSGFENSRFLRYVNISHTKVSNIIPFAKLPSLEHVFCRYTPLTRESKALASERGWSFGEYPPFDRSRLW
jgi:Leucine-rich repeat (LRR) protein